MSQRVIKTNPISTFRFLAVWAIFILLLGGITLKLNLPEMASENMHFGAKYGNIAEAIVTGKGFFNTFQTKSEPTAWSAPLYTYLMAAVFSVTGIKTVASAWMLITLKVFALAFIAALLLPLLLFFGIILIPYVFVAFYVRFRACLLFNKYSRRAKP